MFMLRAALFDLFCSWGGTNLIRLRVHKEISLKKCEFFITASLLFSLLSGSKSWKRKMVEDEDDTST